ncbi:hypothetical protein EBB56_04785 [Halomonas sp. YLB-10]|nr:hypothetical protein EBB56_04785 [Halomonas sp. YLB-10]
MATESSFHSLKVEAIHGERFATKDAIQRQVFEYIELNWTTIGSVAAAPLG